MANLLKRVKGYIAPLLVAYTVLVTYFLAQTAWNGDVDTSGRHHTRILDVLVQEERRHLRNFHDAMQNYRGSIHVELQDKEVAQRGGKRRTFHQLTSNDSVYANENFNSYSNNENTLKRNSNNNIPSYNENAAKHENTDYDDVSDTGDNAAQESYSERIQHARKQAPKQTFQVEVEEWDTQERQRQKQAGLAQHNVHVNQSLHIKQESTQGKNLAYHGRVTQLTTTPRSPSDASYTTDYCDEVFTQVDTSSRPNICKRKLVELGHPNHVALNTSNANFKEFGDIYIYSAFLETRQKQAKILVVITGRAGRKNEKSRYWCIFDATVVSPMSHGKSGKAGKGGHVVDLDDGRSATQLMFTTASDGHKRPDQFYILVCPVPTHAQEELARLDKIHLVIGSLAGPSTGSHQQTLSLNVINNRKAEDFVRKRTEPANKENRDYVHQMENNLGAISSLAEKHNTESKFSNGASIANNKTYSNNSSIPSNRHSHSNGIDNPVIKREETLSTFNFKPKTSSQEERIVTCVAPLHGTISVVQMVEFIELSLLLGSQHIVFYTFKTLDDIREVLQMYENRGLVTVLPWTLPNPKTIWAQGRDAALNDCLYRTLHLFDYGFFLDIDEFFVSHVTSDVPSFLKYLKLVHKFNTSRVSDLVFSSAYFPPPSKDQYKQLTTLGDFSRDVNRFATLKSVHRTYINPKHTLRLLRLDKAFRVGAGERRKTSFVISPKFATFSHYSYCPRSSPSRTPPDEEVNATSSKSHHPNIRDSGTKTRSAGAGNEMPVPAEDAPQDICSRTKVDYVMWRYKSVLIERTKRSVRKLHNNR